METGKLCGCERDLGKACCLCIGPWNEVQSDTGEEAEGFPGVSVWDITEEEEFIPPTVLYNIDSD